jgi:hypothetical protein
LENAYLRVRSDLLEQNTVIDYLKYNLVKAEKQRKGREKLDNEQIQIISNQSSQQHTINHLFKTIS